MLIASFADLEETREEAQTHKEKARKNSNVRRGSRGIPPGQLNYD